MLADIVVGLSYGDEGKGKVTHHLLKNGDYTQSRRR
jgi:adenylosuccinate synthase